MVVLGVLLCIVFASMTSTTFTSHVDSRSSHGATYDYVVVGGGLTGLVVANRLSADPSVTVLVVEYGDIDNSSTTLIPYYANTYNYPDLYNISCAPVPNLENQTFPIWLGKVVGGGTIVNGMMYNRGSAADYNSWLELGNPGWGWDDLQPYFLKSNSFTPPAPDIAERYRYEWDESAYGNGPVQANFPPYQYPDNIPFVDAFRELSIKAQPEGTGVNASGLFWIHTILDAVSQTRSSARTAYYDSVAGRPNLHLLTGHKVNQIIFSDLTATGVRITKLSDNSTSDVSGSREIILAAGAVFTPQVLQLSGVGPKEVLDKAGIRTLLDAPAVGSNLQDHPAVRMNISISQVSFPNPDSLTNNATFNQTAYQEYLNYRTGPYTVARSNSVAWLSLDIVAPEESEQLISDLQTQSPSSYLPPGYSDSRLLAGYVAQRDILTKQVAVGDVAVAELPVNGGGSTACAIQKPFSRGTVHLNPADPEGNPVIQYNALQNPFDAAVVYHMVEYRRRVFNTSAVSRLKPIEIVPGAEARTQEEVISKLLAAKALNPSFAHPSGTCPMMPQALGGCVGPDLQVYGLKRLSIVDASVIPIIPAAHLQATLYAVAEKGADLIKERN